MTHFKKLVAAVALALCSAAGAHAGEIYIPMDPGAPGVFNTSWSFSDLPTGALDDPFPAPHTAGTGFDDLFDFNVPDAQNISISISSIVKGNTFGVDFSNGGGFALYQYADGKLLALQLATSSYFVDGGSWLLTSGTYALEVVGLFATDGGIYAGKISGTPSVVPEASSALMLLMGLAAMAATLRLRRKNQA